MALQKQLVQLAFGQGLEQDTDEKMLDAGKLLVCENAIFKKRGRLSKRSGYDKLSNLTATGSTLSSGTYLADFNSELLQYSNQKLYSYSQSTESWIDKGSIVPSTIRSYQIVKNTASQPQCDSAHNNGISVYAYEDSRGGVRVSVYDSVTETPIAVDQLLRSGSTRARCVALDIYLYVFYYDSGNLYVRRISSLDPGSIGAEVLVSSTVNTTNPNYDVLSFADVRICWAHNVQGSSQVKAGFVDSNPTVLSGVFAPVSFTGAATDSLGLVLGTNSTINILYSNTSNGLSAYVTNIGLGTVAGPVVIDSHTSTAIKNVTGSVNATGITAFYEISAAATYNTYVKTNTLTQAGTAGTASVFLRSVGLMSKAFSFGDQLFVGTVHQSTLQPTYFIHRSDGITVAKMQPLLAGGLTSRPILANVDETSSGVFEFAFTNKVRLESESGAVFSPLGVTKTSVSFNQPNGFVTAQLGNNLHIAGGVLNIYDGQSVVEHGFHLYPENVSAATSGSSGLANGTYQYSVVYEWIDNFGQVHYSAPSVPISVTVSSGPKQVDLTIPTLRITEKKGSRTNVNVTVYRTTASGTTFYKVTSVSSPLANNTAADTVSFSDTNADSAILSNQILYTTGGTLENAGAPACEFCDVYKNRLFLTGLENGQVTWYSKLRDPDFPVEFSDAFTLTTESQGKRLNSLAVLDDKIVLFKKDRFFITYGDGPNNAGLGGGFAEPEFVTADAGCSAPKSIVRTPSGIMFKSDKGIYLLDRQLGLSYVGAGVEDYNSYEVVSGVLSADVNQVRFGLTNGPCLVYDYYRGQWSTFTAHDQLDALIWDGNYTMLRQNGRVYTQNPSIFKDDFSSYRLKLQSGWIALAQQTGYQRVYKLYFLGEYKSDHMLRVKIYYDYSMASYKEYIFKPTTDLEISYYGDSSPYGDESVLGGENRAYRFQVALDRQKCGAIKFEIEDLTTSATLESQESYTISAVGLLVGIKQNMTAIRDKQVMTSV